MGAALNVPARPAATAHHDRLLQDGYCVIPELVGQDVAAALNRDLGPRFEATPFCQGSFYGETTKRFGSLLKRSAAAEKLVMQSDILALVRAALGPYCDQVLLNLTQAIEIHPGAPAQYPHRDQDMWGGPKGSIEYLVNVMWPLVPFTRENGATVIWPGSHPALERSSLPPEESVAATLDPGGAVVFLGSTLHCGGANLTASPRRGIIVSYCLGWLRQFEAQMLIYPPDVARNFAPELAELVGYGIHRPNLGNYEGQSPAVLLGDVPSDYLQAQDALRPEQEAAIAQLKKKASTIGPNP